MGNAIRIGGYPFRIVGVTEAKGGSAFQNPDRNIYIPISTAQTRLPHGESPNSVQYILASVNKAEEADQAIRQITDILRATHRIAPRNPDDFTILNQQDFLAVASTITNVLTIFLGGIGAISLLVGGIDYEHHAGFSNRTDARNRVAKSAWRPEKGYIITISDRVGFVEHVWRTLGIGLGWVIAFIVSRVAINYGTPMMISVTANSILLATLFSAAVGIFFGYYPANRAASLAPVEALRYE